MHEKVREEINRVTEKDSTTPLLVAAEAALSPRSVTRWLAKESVRANTEMAIVRAWGRLRPGLK